MNIKFPIFVGLRYLFAKRRNHFISFISASSMLGLILGVAVLIIVLSVMNGFDRELRTRILGMVPHGILYEKNGIEDWKVLSREIIKIPGVAAVAPLTRLQGMMASQGQSTGVLLTGIDPQIEKNVSILPNHIQSGKLNDLLPGSYHVILGSILARRLNVSIGDKVTLILPQATFSPAGVIPRIKRLTVSGIFSVGAELDSNLAIIHLKDAQKLARLNVEAQSLRVKMDDLFEAPILMQKIARQLEGFYSATDWTRSHGNLFQAIKMEKKMIGLLLLMIVAVAAFNIISTLVMVVTDKQSDIAILRTMGASSKTILAIFMVQGLAIGIVGVALGVLFGIIGALTVSDVVAWVESVLNIQFLGEDVYFINYLPSHLLWNDVLIISSSALLLSFLATIYPSIRASQVQPAEAVRYE
jgi:lipoprotein-releasing system permease protein